MALDWSDMDEAPAEAPRPRRISRIRALIGALLLFALALVCLGLYRKQWVPKEVISNSMLPTIRRGDYVLVDCRPGLTYDVDDVVMYEEPGHVDSQAVKRIVAVAGQTVDWNGRRLAVDNEVLTQIPPDRPSEESEDGYAPGLGHRAPRRVRVPAGHVFLLGDNWGNSQDSFDYGPIPIDAIQGKVSRIYWPPSSWGEIR